MAAGELSKRVAVAVVGIPLALLLVYLGGWVLGAVLAALAALAALELFRLAETRGTRPFATLGAGAAAFFVLAAAGARTVSGASPWLWGAAVAVFVAGSAAAVWRRGGGGAPLASAAITVAGALYTGGTLAFAVFLRHLPDGVGEFAAASLASGGGRWPGTALLVLPLVVTWAADTAAYFAGRRWGKRKLIPAVSPGKTWVGAVAGLATAAGVAAAYSGLVLVRFPPYGMDAAVGALAGVVMGLAALVGDLVESLFKREAGVKDSGRLLPGHGGILDRLDALFFSIPVAYWLVVSWEAVR